MIKEDDFLIRSLSVEFSLKKIPNKMSNVWFIIEGLFVLYNSN